MYTIEVRKLVSNPLWSIGHGHAGADPGRAGPEHFAKARHPSLQKREVNAGSLAVACYAATHETHVDSPAGVLVSDGASIALNNCLF